jgi:hypothetical protein
MTNTRKSAQGLHCVIQTKQSDFGHVSPTHNVAVNVYTDLYLDLRYAQQFGKLENLPNY